MIGILLGIPIGIICSLISWWILFHGYAPKLTFATKINKFRSSNGEMRYRIKFANMGKRNIIDIDLKARLRIKGLYSNSPKVVEIIDLNLTKEKLPVLSPKSQSITHGTMMRIKPEKTEFFYSTNVSKKINEMAKNNELTLEYVMNMGKSATLQFIALGYDEFSGSRKLFQSEKLTVDDILFGKYEKGSLEIIEKIQEEDRLELKENLAPIKEESSIKK